MTTHTVEPAADSADVRELLARDVLAEPRVMYIDRGNNGTTWTWLTQALRSGRAFFGAVRPEVLALDIDGPIGMTVIDPLRAELRRHGIVLVVCRSGGENRRHAFARVEDVTLMQSLRQRLGGHPEVDIRHTIRPPLTPHRRLNASSLLVDLTPEQAHLALRPPHRAALSGRSASLLHSTPDDGDYTGRHLNSLILTYVNAGWPMADAYAQILESPGGARLRREQDRGRDSRAYFIREWNKARLWVVEHPAHTPDFRERRPLLALRNKLWQHRWDGVKGTTDFCLMLVLISKAERLGRTVFDMDTRSLQQLTGLRQEAVIDALTRLEAGHWIARTGSSDPRQAQSIELLEEENRPHEPSTGRGCLGGVGLSGRFLPSDCFAGNRGLGRPAALIYEVVMSANLRVDQLAGLVPLGVSARTDGLKRLVEHHLVTVINGDLEVGDAIPHDVAVVLGNDGYGERRDDRIERERLMHHPQPNANGGLTFIVTAAVSVRCNAVRRDGEPCGSYAVQGETTCREHRVCPWDLQMAEEFEQELLGSWEVA